jgi:hypothetical protein
VVEGKMKTDWITVDVGVKNAEMVLVNTENILYCKRYEFDVERSELFFTAGGSLIVNESMSELYGRLVVYTEPKKKGWFR